MRWEARSSARSPIDFQSDPAILPIVFDAPRRKALVLAPHADDEVLGAGGWICRAADQGWMVHVLFATISGFRSLPRDDHSGTPTRVAEAEAALACLGAAGYDCLFIGEERHLRLDTVPKAELTDFVERALARHQPSVVIIPTRAHYHQDHRAFAEAAVAALRPMPGGRWPMPGVVLAYGHALEGWGGGDYRFKPSAFVDISNFLDRKLEALTCYATQLCAPPHPRSCDAVRANAASWGAHAGCAYAEPFECLRLLL